MVGHEWCHYSVNYISLKSRCYFGLKQSMRWLRAVPPRIFLSSQYSRDFHNDLGCVTAFPLLLGRGKGHEHLVMLHHPSV